MMLSYAVKMQAASRSLLTTVAVDAEAAASTAAAAAAPLVAIHPARTNLEAGCATLHEPAKLPAPCLLAFGPSFLPAFLSAFHATVFCCQSHAGSLTEPAYNCSDRCRSSSNSSSPLSTPPTPLFCLPHPSSCCSYQQGNLAVLYCVCACFKPGCLMESSDNCSNRCRSSSISSSPPCHPAHCPHQYGSRLCHIPCGSRTIRTCLLAFGPCFCIQSPFQPPIPLFSKSHNWVFLAP